MATEEKYLELYKKHKPKRWKDIIGQDKIVRSLRATVKSHRVPVAYLFSGPRGTGKTSAAKVLAAAINCENEKAQKLGEACGSCPTCLNIQDDNQLGVNYVSMANNGGVEEVRKIVDRARLSQPVAKVVWILDEVHNLSAAAWDSLLIPLESAKMPALFILCSTEAHKIPAPIMSRIQSRRFNLVAEDTMKDYVTKLAAEDELEVDEQMIEAAVRLGRGSVRDTLTELETILNTGDFEESLNEELLLAIQNADVLSALKVISKYADTGEKMRYFAEDLYSDLRDLLLLRTRGGEELVAHKPLEDMKTFKAKLGAKEHLLVLDALGESVTAMSVGAADHRIILESALLKALQRVKRAQRAV